MKKEKAVVVLGIIFLLLAAAAGALFVLRPTIIDMQRQKAEVQIMERIESGSTDISDIKAPEMEGEESEFSELEPPEERPEVLGYGVIAIPKIDLQMPVVEGADSWSLRASAGWYPESAEMGQAGNCAIFGHRMYEYGRHFNRLDELEKDDIIKLYDADGHTFKYVITGKEVIKPDILMDTLADRNDGFSLTLVTCTPTGVGSHRLLIYAKLDVNSK